MLPSILNFRFRPNWFTALVFGKYRRVGQTVFGKAQSDFGDRRGIGQNRLGRKSKSRISSASPIKIADLRSRCRPIPPSIRLKNVPPWRRKRVRYVYRRRRRKRYRYRQGSQSSWPSKGASFRITWVPIFSTAANSCFPFVVIPTTAGTGSEVTKVAVIADPDNDVKLPFAEEQFLPQLAILDPK
jgi:hypothetical protein